MIVDVYRKRRWFGWKWVGQFDTNDSWLLDKCSDGSTRLILGKLYRYRWEK